MEKAIWFKGGQVAAEDSPKLEELDVLVEGGKISRVANNVEAPDGVEVVDCGGCVIVPAMFDVHVHAREPGARTRKPSKRAARRRSTAG